MLLGTLPVKKDLDVFDVFSESECRLQIFDEIRNPFAFSPKRMIRRARCRSNFHVYHQCLHADLFKEPLIGSVRKGATSLRFAMTIPSTYAPRFSASQGGADTSLDARDLRLDARASLRLCSKDIARRSRIAKKCLRAESETTGPSHTKCD